VNLLFTVKNAAISVYDATGDPRSRYVSPHSLEAIYDFGKDKFRALGIADARQFISTYAAARQELELTVDTLFTKALSEHPASSELEALLALPKAGLPRACIDAINGTSENPHSVISFAAWLTMMGGASGRDMNAIADNLMNNKLDRVWGGIMAVVCSPATEDRTLSKLADWLVTNEKGAYLIKLITRNPSASPETRAQALQYYKLKEIIT
jgi:hypothetical protein